MIGECGKITNRDSAAIGFAAESQGNLTANIDRSRLAPPKSCRSREGSTPGRLANSTSAGPARRSHRVHIAFISRQHAASTIPGVMWFNSRIG